jgi:hypothetical protein
MQQRAIETSHPQVRRRRASFRQADLSRAIKASAEAGLKVTMARIGSDGCIELVFGEPEAVPSSPGVNTWDRLCQK